jgi:hypothetical protein
MAQPERLLGVSQQDNLGENSPARDEHEARTDTTRKINAMLWVNVPICSSTRDGKVRLNRVLREHLLASDQQDVELPAALFMDEILTYIGKSVGFQFHDIERYGTLLARKLLAEGSFNPVSSCLDCGMRELIQAVMSSVDELTAERNRSVAKVFRSLVADGSVVAASAVWLWDVLSLITGYESHIGGLDSLGKNKDMHLQVRNIPVIPLAHLQGLHESNESQLRVATVKTLLEWVGVGVLELRSAVNVSITALGMQAQAQTRSAAGTREADSSTDGKYFLFVLLTCVVP